MKSAVFSAPPRVGIIRGDDAMLGIAGLLDFGIRIEPRQKPCAFDLGHGIRRLEPVIGLLETGVIP